MASSWGSSWGSAWGNSWGTVSGAAPYTQSDPGAGFSREDRSSPRRVRRRSQYLKRALAHLESLKSAPLAEEQEITAAVIEQAVETIEATQPELVAEIATAPIIKAVIPDYMALPRQMAQNREALAAMVAAWMIREAERRQAEEDEEDEMLLLAVMH